MGEFRKKDIIDEIEEKIKQQKIEDEANAAKDMTYEKFLALYGEHIDGKVEADDKGRPFTAEGAESKDERTGKQGGTFDNQTEEMKLDEGMNNSQMDKGFESVNRSRQDIKELNKSKESILSNQDYKHDIPQSCMLDILKGCRIEKLHKKYILAAYPFPLLEGEMVLF